MPFVEVSKFNDESALSLTDKNASAYHFDTFWGLRSQNACSEESVREKNVV